MDAYGYSNHYPKRLPLKIGHSLGQRLWLFTVTGGFYEQLCILEQLTSLQTNVQLTLPPAPQYLSKKGQRIWAFPLPLCVQPHSPQSNNFCKFSIRG